MEERTVQAGGIAWRVRRRSGGGVVPLVLLHGFTGSGRLWEAMLSFLRPRPLLIPDLPGHGSTAGPPASWEISGGIEALTDALGELLDREGASLADLAGYSMGGRVALAFAARHPARVRRLVVISASPGLRDAGERETRRESDEALARLLEEEGIAAFVERWEALPLFANGRTLPEETRAWLRSLRIGNDPRGLAAALRAFGTGRMSPLWESLGAMAFPVLLVVGGKDAKAMAVSAETAARLPDSRVAVLPGCGHLLPVESPRELAALIDAFLAEPPRARSAEEEGRA